MSIDMTTYSASLSERSGPREQVDVAVLKANGSDSDSPTILELKITPSSSSTAYLYDLFTTGIVSKKTADNIAKMIFEAIDVKVSK